MALNPLSLGTDGALKRGAINSLLVLGVSGMLFFGGPPIFPPEPPITPPITKTGGGGYRPFIERDIYEQQEENNRFLIEFLKTATYIINNQ